MKPAMLMPIRSSASRTLTTAMIPSRRFVVPRFPSMIDTSERRRLMRRLISRRPLALAERLVQEPPSFARHAGGLRHRAAQVAELPCEIFESGLELATHRAAALCEQQVAGKRADDPAHDGRCHCPVVHRARLLYVGSRPYLLFKLCATSCRGDRPPHSSIHPKNWFVDVGIQDVHLCRVSALFHEKGERDAVPALVAWTAGRFVFERHRADTLRIDVEPADEVFAGSRCTLERLHVPGIMRRELRIAFDHQN